MTATEIYQLLAHGENLTLGQASRTRSAALNMGDILSLRQQQWGSGAIEAISERLQKELPGLQGFSPESINKMRRFYEEWSSIVFQSPLAANIENAIQQPLAGKNTGEEKWQPSAAEIRQPSAGELLLKNTTVPWA